MEKENEPVDSTPQVYDSFLFPDFSPFLKSRCVYTYISLIWPL